MSSLSNTSHYNYSHTRSSNLWKFTIPEIREIKNSNKNIEKRKCLQEMINKVFRDKSFNHHHLSCVSFSSFCAVLTLHYILPVEK